MCGFVGYCNLKKDLSKENNILENMNTILKKRGPDEEGYFYDTNIKMGHRRLIIIDAENGKQPMSVRCNDNTYTIVYNGQIYNKEEIKKELQELGYEFMRIFGYRSSLKSIYRIWNKFIKKIKWYFQFCHLE